jgi:UDP-glucuronate decarboxylase
MVNLTKQCQEDLEYIFKRVAPAWVHANSSVLITGANGFLGYYMSRFFMMYFKELRLEKLTLADLNVDISTTDLSANVNIINCDLTDVDNLPSEIFDHDIIINLASFASPVKYRSDPIGTIRGSVTSVWSFLERYVHRTKTKGCFQIFSSSEIYGDPTSANIPTSEEFWGNVSCLGPRSCYDESKRFVETLGYNYAKRHHENISIVRPFNNYGPGMKLNDGRLPADVMRAILERRTLDIFSDGAPTRSFCYVADAIVGYLLALCVPGFSVFNIGNDAEEISIKNFVERSSKVMTKFYGKPLHYQFSKSDDAEFLTNNPNRRFPNIQKARKILNFDPSISIEDGMQRWIQFEQQKVVD